MLLPSNTICHTASLQPNTLCSVTTTLAAVSENLLTLLHILGPTSLKYKIPRKITHTHTQL